MELQFTLTPTHTQIRLEEQLSREMHQHDQQQARLLARVAQAQDRLLAPSLFILCVVAGTLAIFLPERQFSSEKVISMALSGVIFLLFWWFGSPRLLGYLRARIAARRAEPRAPLRGVNQRLIEARLRIRLKAIEGSYRLQFDDQGFTLINARGAKGSLAWGEIVRVRQTPDFYSIASAELDHKGEAYHIPKRSDAMDAQQFQQGLELFFSRIPASNT